jgi:hypothetical protein
MYEPLRVVPSTLTEGLHFPLYVGVTTSKHCADYLGKRLDDQQQWCSSALFPVWHQQGRFPKSTLRHPLKSTQPLKLDGDTCTKLDSACLFRVVIFLPYPITLNPSLTPNPNREP